MEHPTTASLSVIATLFAIFLAPPAQAQQDTLYVDQSASGANDGTSWSNAYVHLQDALDEAEGIRGQVILVAEGTYYPDEDSDGDHADDDPEESFGAGIDLTSPTSELLGGYPSGGGDRNPETHRTILSGDITQDDSTTSAGITPTVSAINGDNSYHVLDISGNATPETVIDGFVITGGQANGSGANLNNRGGGMLNSGSPTLLRLTFVGNSAGLSGGGMHNRPGAFQVASSPFIANCSFVGNRAQNGGALTNRSNASDEEASPTVVNTLFSGNRATFLNGGAVFNFGSRGPVRPIYINVAFSGNVVQGEGDASKGGAMANQGSDGPAEVELHNAVFWGNAAEGPGDQIANTLDVSLTVSHSLLEGGVSAISNEQGASTADEGGNIDADPQFVNAGGADGKTGTLDDDLRLEGPGSGGGASPALDAGDGQVLPPDSADIDRDGNVSEDLPIDRFGNPRVQSATGGSTVDMGMHESDGSPLPVELARLDASANGKTVRLTWTTTSETGNAGFEVQRRASENSGWNRMGYVESKASGRTTTEATSYEYVASGLPVGTHQFRLRQVDLDGSSQVYGPVEVNLPMQEALTLTAPAPNPVSSTATFSFAVKEQTEATVTVYDLLGRKVATLFEGPPAPGESTRLQLDASTLPSGQYLIRLRADGQTRSQRLTVVR